MTKQNILRFFRATGSFMYRYKFTILYMLFIALVAYMPIDFAPSMAMAIHVLSFLLLINLLAKTKYTFLFSVILAIVLVFNAYLAITFRSGVTQGILASIIETNSAEAISMLKSAAIGGPVIIIITLCLILLSEKELRKFSSLSRKLSIIGLLIYLLVFLPLLTLNRAKKDDMMQLLREFPISVAQTSLNMYAPILYGNIATVLAYNQEANLMDSFEHADSKPLPEDIVLKPDSATIKKVFVVIGESASREHFSLYGYPIQTTPFVDSLASTPNSPLCYYKGIAAAPFTRDALRIALTFATPLDMQPFYIYKTVVNMANDAGYETLWISNQGKSGVHDSYLGYLAATASYTYFESKGYLAQDDLQLLPVIRRNYKTESKQFFVIHLVGSHGSYSDRYDAIDAAAIPGKKSLAIEYDRSIHHTDRVLRDIYEIVKQDSSSVMYYFSDHAETIGIGHGLKSAGIKQFNIPIIGIDNNSQNKLNNIISQYVNPESKTLNNSSTIYILAQLMGYTISPEYLQKSIEDGQYIRHVDGRSYLYESLTDK